MIKLNKQKLIYESAKLKEEVRALENKNKPSFFDRWTDFSSLITVLVALAGVFITVWKFLKEQNTQKQNELRQAEKEFRLRAEERFHKTTENLASTSPSLQASSAVSLMSFLKDDYYFLHEQIFFICIANLKTHQKETVNHLLVKVFEKAIRIYLNNHENKNVQLDLSRTNLKRVDLRGLDLNNADLGFANLDFANLEGTNLTRVRGYNISLKKAHLSNSNMNEARLQKADFRDAIVHDANLVAADLKGSNLQNVEFQQSQLQSAHFENSDITGAKFEKSNLADTFFKEIKYSKETLKSIKKAYGWEKANYDKNLDLIIKAS